MRRQAHTLTTITNLKDIYIYRQRQGSSDIAFVCTNFVLISHFLPPKSNFRCQSAATRCTRDSKNCNHYTGSKFQLRSSFLPSLSSCPSSFPRLQSPYAFSLLSLHGHLSQSPAPTAQAALPPTHTILNSPSLSELCF